MPVSEELFRSALSRFASGVTIVTTLDASNKPVGLTVSSFCSLSLSPPLILICIDKDADSFKSLSLSRHFVVNILSAGQEEISRLFAGEDKDGELFKRLKTTPAIGGIPAIDGALATIECTTVNQYEGGDHVIFVGQVEEVESSEGEPLVYFRGRYKKITSNTNRIRS